jgi:hypothetical protein
MPVPRFHVFTSGQLSAFVVERSEAAQARGWTGPEIESQVRRSLHNIDIPDTRNPLELPVIWILLSASKIDVIARPPQKPWPAVQKTHLAKCTLSEVLQLPWRIEEIGQPGHRSVYHRVWDKFETVAKHFHHPSLARQQMIVLSADENTVSHCVNAHVLSIREHCSEITLCSIHSQRPPSARQS